MARNKKISKKAVDEAVNQENQRLSIIAQFNQENAGRFWIDATKSPTDEDIAKAKADFENATKALKEKSDYFIADKDNALRVAKFLKDFNDNALWTGRTFVGIINFSSEMNDFIEDCEKNGPKDLVLTYGPMQYAFLIMENYGGIGLESAKRMAEIWDEYIPIYEKLHEHVDWYKNEAHKCDNLQSRWALFEQGYYVYVLEDTEVDPVPDDAKADGAKLEKLDEPAAGEENTESPETTQE